MAGSLRELVAKVVFKLQGEQLLELDKLLDKAKQKLQSLDSAAAKGVKPNADTTKLTEMEATADKAAGALRDLGTAAETELGDVDKAAQKASASLDELKTADVKPKIDEEPLVGFATQIKFAADGLMSLAETSGLVSNDIKADLDKARAAGQELQKVTTSATGQTAVDAGQIEAFGAALGKASDQARTIQAEMVRLSQVDPKSERIVELDAALLALQGNTRKAVDTFKGLGLVDLDASTKDLIDLRVAVQGVEGALSPEKIEEYSAKFKAAEARAEAVRKALDRLKAIDPKNPKIPELASQLNAVEQEAKQTAAALQKVGVASKSAGAEASGLGGQLSGLTGMLGTLGIAFGVTQIASWGKAHLDAADQVGKLSSQLGIATDELQAWMAFTSQAGGSTEHLSVSVKTLAKQMDTVALTGKGPAADAFKTLGIEVQDAEGKLKPLGDTLLAVGGALGELESDAKRVAMAQMLLGEGGVKLLPGFKNGTAAAKEQLDTLKDLAVVYSEEFIANAEAANDEMDLFKRQLGGVGSELMLTVLPLLRWFVRTMTPVAKLIRDTAKNSSILQAAFGMLGIKGLGMLLSKFGGLRGIVMKLLPLIAKFLLPMLILDDIIVFLKGGNSMLGQWIDKLFGFEGAGKLAAEGVREAFKVLAGTLKFVWGMLSGDKEAMAEGEESALKFYNFLKHMFEDLGAFFVDFWNNKVPGWAQVGLIALVTVATGGLAGLYLAWQAWGDDVQNYLGGVWDSIIAGLTGMIDSAKQKLIDLASNIPGLSGLFSDEGGKIEERITGASANAQSGLAVGGNASVNSSISRTSNVTLNDHRSFSATVSGVQDGKGVGSALRQTEGRVGSMLGTDRRQTLRQVVGADG